MSTPLTVLSLYSGVGGLDLGLQRAGMTIVGQVEVDPFCRAVLARHWPKVDRHDDVRTAPAWWHSRPRPIVDVVAGGFPCQPFSQAGRRQGTTDGRWAWPLMAAVVREVRPRYVLVENVPGLLRDRQAFATILAQLAEFGLDAQWTVLSACAVGAPHVRARLLLVAYPHRVDGTTWLGPGTRWPIPRRRRGTGAWPDPVDGMLAASRRSHRMVDGLPPRLDRSRIAALGNAVVPQVAEHVGRLILAHDQTCTPDTAEPIAPGGPPPAGDDPGVTSLRTATVKGATS